MRPWEQASDGTQYQTVIRAGAMEACVTIDYLDILQRGRAYCEHLMDHRVDLAIVKLARRFLVREANRYGENDHGE